MELDKVKAFIDEADEETILAIQEYIHDRKWIGKKEVFVVEIPYKFPSFNEYTNACRRNRYGGASMKKKVQEQIGWYLTQFPEFKKPVYVQFTWVEGNKMRDFDNVQYAKKFIFDELVQQGKLIDDSQKWVKTIPDKFQYSKGEWKAIVRIKEVEDGKS